MKYALSALLAFCFISLTITNAHAFYCGAETAGRGDYAADVEKKCGRPFKKIHSWTKIDGKKRFCEKWYYNCGYNDFMYELIIIDKKVFKEEAVRKGTGNSRCKANR
ncbi:MAG: DUF2845 domain-containing protein [Smithella sp.]